MEEEEIPQDPPKTSLQVERPQIIRDAGREENYSQAQTIRQVWVPKKRPQQQRNALQWRPKKTEIVAQSKTKQKNDCKKEVHESKIVSARVPQIWALKNLLKAQGFYKGVTNLWLPKQHQKSLLHTNEEASTSTSKTIHKDMSSRKRTTHVWKPNP